MGKAKGTQERSLSCESGSGLLGAGKATSGRAVPGRWAENSPCQPSLSPPRAPHPGDSARRFSFLFCFSSCRPARGSFARKTAPSLSCGRARRQPAPPPRSSDLPAPAFCPCPPQLGPLLHAPAPLCPNNRLGEQPKTAARSEACAWRGRNARPLAAGLGGAVPGADAASESSRVALAGVEGAGGSGAGCGT